MASRKQIVTLNDAPSKGKVIDTIGGIFPYLPMISHVPLKTVDPPRLRGQPPVSNHHNSTKTSSFTRRP